MIPSGGFSLPPPPLTEALGRVRFDRHHESRNGYLRGVRDKEMDVVVLPVSLDELRVEPHAGIPHGLNDALSRPIADGSPSILGHEDYMRAQIKDDVSPPPVLPICV